MSTGGASTEGQDPFCDRAEECDLLFTSLLAALSGLRDSEKLHAATEDQHRRFERWVKAFSAFALPEAPLDTRLRLIPDVRGSIFKLLETLHESLQHELSQLEQIKHDGSRLSALYQVAIDASKDIPEAIDKLFDLIEVIESNPRFRFASRSSRIANNLSEERQFIERLDLLIVRGLYPNISPTFADQLARSISFRRQRLLQVKDRHQKLRTELLQKRGSTTTEAIGEDKAPEADFKTAASQTVQSNNVRNSVRASFGMPSSSRPSSTRIRKAPPDLPDEVEEITRTSTIRSSTSIYGYPRAPEWSESESHVQCSYCLEYIPLPAQHYQWQSVWRAHVSRDLQPYVCISEECREHIIYFESRQKWRKHMNEEHTMEWTEDIHKKQTWYCDLDQHDLQEFNSSSDLDQHLSTEHKAGCDDEEKEIMIKYNFVSAPRGPSECPLCGTDVAVERSEFQDVATASASAQLEAPSSDVEIRPKARFHSSNILALSDDDESPNTWAESISEKTSMAVGQIRASSQANHMKLTAHIARHLKSLAFTSLRFFNDEVASVKSGSAVHGVDDECSSNGSSYYAHMMFSEGSLDFEDSPSTSLEPSSSLSNSDSLPLGDLILEHFQYSQFDGRHENFLPEGMIDELVTEESVRHELDMSTTGYVDVSLINWILDEAKKVFAITLMSGVTLGAAMKAFQAKRFGDVFLPVPDPLSRNWEDTGTAEKFNNRIWSKVRLHSFYRAQWRFLVPVFRKRGEIMHMYPESILPFTWVANNSSAGGFSRVLEVKIHASHYRDILSTGDGPPGNVAIKEFRDRRGDGDDVTIHEWDLETRALQDIGKLGHPHIISCLATFSRGQQRYHMFPWANGGNLRDLWRSLRKPSFSAEMVLKVVTQLRGLADALCALHNFRHDGSASFRHGDLKPENILVFKEESQFGTLKMADMGLAKFHSHETKLRNAATTTRFGTVRYEPPEASLQLHGPRSRLFDIWSLGCITLEMLVWLLYGQKGLDQFSDSLVSGSRDPSSFFEITAPEGRPIARLHHVVWSCMNHIRKADPECSKDSAVRDILDLIKEKLLVINLRPSKEITPVDFGTLISVTTEDTSIKSPYRASASEVRDALDNILEKVRRNNDYLITGKPRSNLALNFSNRQLESTSHLVTGNLGNSLVTDFHDHQIKLKQSVKTNPNAPEDAPSSAASLSVLTRTKQDYSLPLVDTWKFHVDNEFASKAYERLGDLEPPRDFTRSYLFCYRCSRLDFCTAGFYIDDEVSELENRSRSCDLCRLLFKGLMKVEARPRDFVRFERIDSVLKVTDIHHPPVLSLCKSPKLETSALIQVGFPEISQLNDPLQCRIMKLWLEDCDQNHDSCQPQLRTGFVPSRLVDIKSHQIRLCVPNPEKNLRYAVLSLSAGRREMGIEITPLDISTSLNNIPPDLIPTQMPIAIVAAKALGIPYIWIDSLCSVKGANSHSTEDYEEILQSAYCVLSFIFSSTSGIIPRRSQRPRDYVSLGDVSNAPLYVCEFIDDFDRDVLGSEKYKRAWSLQDRVLARRTIYLTEGQAYWECGAGIRCETMTSMSKQSVSVLGDPNFPYFAMKNLRITEAQTYQALYSNYSRLTFSDPLDRRIAIRGIQQRLARAFDCYAAFGCFFKSGTPSVLGRSLLWYSPDRDSRILKIFYPKHHEPLPSWSWMAYLGPIEYLEVPYGLITWNDELDSLTSTGGIDMLVSVQETNLQPEDQVMRDTPAPHAPDVVAYCVVISSWGLATGHAKWYVLLVEPGVLDGEQRIFERVGIAVLKRARDWGAETVVKGSLR